MIMLQLSFTEFIIFHQQFAIRDDSLLIRLWLQWKDKNTDHPTLFTSL